MVYLPDEDEKEDGKEVKVGLKKLAEDVLHLMWTYTFEEKLVHSNAQGGILTRQVQNVAIENLCQTLTLSFPLASFYFMKECTIHIKRNFSVI